jgi:hypothetical protein
MVLHAVDAVDIILFLVIFTGMATAAFKGWMLLNAPVIPW